VHKKCITRLSSQNCSRTPRGVNTSVKDHNFQNITLNKPTWCIYCNTFIWGLTTGYKCTECHSIAHKKCIDSAPVCPGEPLGDVGEHIDKVYSIPTEFDPDHKCKEPERFFTFITQENKEEGYEEIKNKLLINSFNALIRNEKDLTPLMVSAKLNRLDVILLLLNHPDIYDPEVLAQTTEESGHTFIHFLANYSSTDESDIFLLQRIIGKVEELENKTSCGSILNSGDENGNTPLHLAVKKGNRIMVDVLLGFENVDLNAENKKCETPITLCIIKSDNHLAKSFYSKLNKKIKGKKTYVQRLFFVVIDDLRPTQKNKMFLSFISDGLVGPLEWFVNHSPYIHKSLDEDGFGGLHIAARENKLEVMQYLLSTKKDGLIDMEKAPNGNSPLHLFVRNTPQPEEENVYMSLFDELIQYMKHHKISDNPIELQNKDGETPLHAACLKSNPFSIKLLLLKGANVTALSINKETPIHYGIRFFTVDTLQMILHNVLKETLVRVIEMQGVEGNIMELAEKYKPQLVPLFETLKK